MSHKSNLPLLFVVIFMVNSLIYVIYWNILAIHVGQNICFLGIMLTGVVQYRLTVIHTAVPPVSQPGVAGPPVTTAHRGRPMFLVILDDRRMTGS